MRAFFIRVLMALVLAAGLGGLATARAKPMPIKVVVVTTFEIGADTGDFAGEFQPWVEGLPLKHEIVIPGIRHVARYSDDGVLVIVSDMRGRTRESVAALILSPQFDLTKAYWLVSGIAGVDPKTASVGSAAWARWVVQGDTLREFDDREVPKAWPYGLFAIGAKAPNTLPDNPDSFAGMTDAGPLNMALKLNPGLARWAFDMTKDTPIPDNPALQAARAAWKGFPNAQRPPFVLMGETLGAQRYWHGPGRTQWARDWVKLWTGGQGVFAMTNMESQSLAGAMLTASKAGLVDMDRVLVLRTASNPSTPPPGVSAIDSVGDEGPGQLVAFEANYRVGVPVVHELLNHWDRYKDAIPGSPGKP